MTNYQLPITKSQLRRKMQARRSALSEAEREAAAAAFTRNALAFFSSSFRTAARPEKSRSLRRYAAFEMTQPAVAGYWPIRGELDVRPLLTALHEQGKQICLPLVPATGRILSFHRWEPGMALEQGPFGTRQPPASAPEVTPGILLVPLLAFDSENHRLGHGGGYYDATLAQRRVQNPDLFALGCAYAFQRVETLPADPHDMRLDAVLTD